MKCCMRLGVGCSEPHFSIVTCQYHHHQHFLAWQPQSQTWTSSFMIRKNAWHSGLRLRTQGRFWLLLWEEQYLAKWPKKQILEMMPRVRRDTTRLRVLNLLLWTDGGQKYTLNNPQKRMMVRYDEAANSGQCSHPGISFADYSPNPARARSQVCNWSLCCYLLWSAPASASFSASASPAEVFLFTPATTILQHNTDTSWLDAATQADCSANWRTAAAMLHLDIWPYF